MKKIFFLGLVFLYAMLLAVAAGHAQSLKVLTYNIHHANPPSQPDSIDLLAVARVIRDSGAELVALQEVDVYTERSGMQVNQAAELGRLTGMRHYFAKAIDYQGGEYGVAILSKHPFITTENHPLPMAEGVGGEPRTLALAVVEPRPGKPIVFACTHLDLKAENKLLQAKHIIDLLADRDYPVILGGDFNAQPDSEVIQLLDGYLQRSQSSVGEGFTIPVNSPNREIDFIMFGPAGVFQVVRHEVINEQYASDHLPVYVELDL
ncbi:Metal-dependent hydrolase, endonuclease/exonuclease/phosphatase family [Parapedobacter composti]|uniref:Metal-dependent hydrolase, endonuclease/exonuclease/phosphatase family n=1 Tax=Parapedobacter composti TaxID=623281 RepID=A0A1I1L585_9SPHI|nr:endonuclease/exonuclease/phosphatase family protein [Parapedobacter composti]SFC68207.1 Metal-dependent hydrolase, endonuclease/exonuclease/phosphatase family [Parapedobacter composti]